MKNYKEISVNFRFISSKWIIFCGFYDKPIQSVIYMKHICFSIYLVIQNFVRTLKTHKNGWNYDKYFSDYYRKTSRIFVTVYESNHLQFSQRNL